MKKPLPNLRRLTLPALICCLPWQPLAAAAAAPAAWRVVVPVAAGVTGRVVDTSGAGIPGVNVIVKGTSVGTQTDADGRYSLDAPEGATLVFSFVGYASQEVLVSGRSTVDVTLATDSKALGDVVVVGYLAQDRQNVTSAVSSVNVQEAAKTPASTLVQGLQGRVAGVTIESAGNPGAVPNVLIRGVGTTGSGANPLYVIDGLWTDNIRDLSPNDIESTTVLKDASSTAVYGSRGANGAILITTKKGQSGEPKISFSGYKGGGKHLPQIRPDQPQ